MPPSSRPIPVLLACTTLALGCVSTESDTNPKAAGRWRFEAVDAGALGLWEGGRPVLVYNHGPRLKPGVPADRTRASYVHPLYGLDGEVLTDDFPADHFHHRGLFWGWPHVGLGARHFDSWALQGITNRWERWGRRESAGDTAVLEVENGWYVGDTRVMSERVQFTVHPARKDARAIDVSFTWTPLVEPVRLAGAEGKSYGGLTLRYAAGTNTVITTPEGNSAEDLYLTRLPWADLTRRWEATGSTSGAALFVGPDHPDFPPTWLTRHYGALCIGWPGVEGRTFPVGQPIRCRYRVWIHRGAASAGEVREAYEEYQAGLPKP